MTEPTKFETVSTEPAKKAVLTSYKDFNASRDFDNTLQRYALIYPGKGDTGHHMMIRSMHSRHFRDAQIKAQRKMSSMIIANGGKDDPNLDDVMEDLQMQAFASVVASWSFEEPCTVENVSDFLRHNSFAYDDINILAGQDSLFLNNNESN